MKFENKKEAIKWLESLDFDGEFEIFTYVNVIDAAIAKIKQELNNVTAQRTPDGISIEVDGRRFRFSEASVESFPLESLLAYVRDQTR